MKPTKEEITPEFVCEHLTNKCYKNSFMLDIMISGIRQFSGFSPGTLVSSTNYSECHNIAEILLKVTLVDAVLCHRTSDQ
jgi:hypothetical protein